MDEDADTFGAKNNYYFFFFSDLLSIFINYEHFI